MMLVDLRGQGITGKDAEHVLGEVCITCNKIRFRMIRKSRSLPVVFAWAALL